MSPGSRRNILVTLLAMGFGVTAATPVIAQAPRAGDPFSTVDPATAAGDKPGNWTLHFRYAPPRIITVDVPGKGKVTAWYMVYRIFNTTSTPQAVTSLKFDLVTKDLNTTHLDEPQPAVFKAIAAKEDPEKNMNLLTTVQVTQNPIPVTKPDSFPRYVSGIAIWTDVDLRANRTNKFSVYVSGLSDGLVAEKQVDASQLIKVKTLQLDFQKPTDNIRPGVDDVKREDNGGLGGERWIYRPVDKKPAPKE
ncbi:hypothetical protein [Limnoglobus roseus]|uniref:TIGR03009 domain-containing protein n=1 Tax=Limnoglobus roseus TaxID=2598579 RepID=A0A5C1AKB8_9BACT|nr:hypothetical protein [Limnoglobus roseus]QEL18456.1 hypothetical protein PX52LOC_05481 [Limnoglobus roseus]